MNRRYTLDEKMAAVATAERTSIESAAQAHGVPRQTLQYWYHAPEFGELRQKTRDELAEGAILGAHLALGELLERIRSGKLRDTALVTAFGVFVDKAQLLSGMATQRTETRDISGTLSDAELRDALREAAALTGGERAAQAPAGAPAD